jgi:Sulphur oxidation protein SoxZ
MADPMKIRASFKDGGVDLRILMAHEMETGQRKDQAGSKPIGDRRFLRTLFYAPALRLQKLATRSP